MTKRARQDGEFILNSVEDFLALEDTPQGHVSILSGGAYIDLYVEPFEDSRSIIFCFHGAIDPETRLPYFLGRGVTSGLPATRVFVSDPSLIEDTSFSLGWYLGSPAQPRLVDDLCLIFNKLCLLSRSLHMIFFGSSGGGFAALQFSRFFPGSLALPMNPQTDLVMHRQSQTARFTRAVWGKELIEEMRYDLPVNLVHLYAMGSPNTVGYIQNCNDWFHIQKHQVPFMRAHGASGRVFMLMDRWGNGQGLGHDPAPKDVVRSILAAAAVANGSWAAALRENGFSNETSTAEISATLKRKPHPDRI